MKKLLFLALIALQGASIVAMKEDGKRLEGKAQEYFRRIMNEAPQLKAEVVERLLHELSEDEARQLVRAKKRQGTALIALVSQFNNPGLIRVLLAHGANPYATTKDGTPAKHNVKHEAVKAVFEEYEGNPKVLIHTDKKKLNSVSKSARLGTEADDRAVHEKVVSVFPKRPVIGNFLEVIEESSDE